MDDVNYLRKVSSIQRAGHSLINMKTTGTPQENTWVQVKGTAGPAHTLVFISSPTFELFLYNSLSDPLWVGINSFGSYDLTVSASAWQSNKAILFQLYRKLCVWKTWAPACRSCFKTPFCSCAPASLARSGHLSQGQPMTLRLIIDGVLPNKNDLC